jgi:hypothetical protein
MQKSNCIVEEEKRIPLHQHSIVDIPLNPCTSHFVSKTKREIFPNTTISEADPTAKKPKT